MATDAKPKLTSVEAALTLGEMKITGRLVDATNATLMVNVVEGENEIVCVYKPIAGERPLWDFSTGTLAHRELAAYLVSSLGNFGVVPLTILRDGPYGEGMVQQWINIDESLDMWEFFRGDEPPLRNIALFDAVINNTDRKIGHLLPNIHGKVYGCDHGVTFHPQDKLRTVLWQWAGQPLSASEVSQLQDLRNLLSHSLGEMLLPLLSTAELASLEMRLERLLTLQTFPVPSNEWPSVPWPPF
ncbi:MAG: SCO1664 family protein [Candidatus Nanopelagicaceae bacterium]|nr:SCO1664 family protein [Candidatus Nanopelagicaceae bacterium]